MWERMIFGCDSYHVILWFLTYSILGWIVESIYMSLCNKKLTNRGFVRGPFCPIYGVGALTVFFILRRYSDRVFVLFILGSLLATTLEYVTAILMNKIFGEIWWDYSDKPFNYKGVLCLESSIAWGFYTVALFAFLHKMVMGIVKVVPFHTGRFVGSIILIVFTVDFAIALWKEKKDVLPEQVSDFKEMIIDRITR
ncbi:putative ABC transporter permease [Lachnospiraceae bacterium LCP25S3_G4]